MNAGKSTLLLQAAHNYQERGMESYLLTAQFDNRAGDARIGSRIGIGREADTFSLSDDLFYKIKKRINDGPCACVFIDEAQFLSHEQVWAIGPSC
uniref:thymidine kinase n=1 Tax=uncultured alpha proteobacterium EB080_L27A02 TaxID=710796 RepID=E0Y104_9PROT|nr:thymidine kinase [uncultured alpha proteobacterium EB080_L27A02]